MALIAAIGVGCAGERTMVAQPAVEVWPAAEAQLDFVDELRTKPIVSNADALHVLLFFAGEEPSGEWGESMERARELGWVASGVELAPRASAEAGLMLSVIARVSELELGLAGALAGLGEEGAGPWRPGSLVGVVATTRARRLGLMPDRSANQGLSGPELLAVLRRAEIYEQTVSRQTAGASGSGGGAGGSRAATLPGGEAAEAGEAWESPANR